MPTTKIELQTKFGAFVTKGYVPPFKKSLEPEVITWCERTFKFHGFTSNLEIAIYREVFAYPLILTERK
jgi:hypothetical protein